MLSLYLWISWDMRQSLQLWVQNALIISRREWALQCGFNISRRFSWKLPRFFIDLILPWKWAILEKYCTNMEHFLSTLLVHTYYKQARNYEQEQECCNESFIILYLMHCTSTVCIKYKLYLDINFFEHFSGLKYFAGRFYEYSSQFDFF